MPPAGWGSASSMAESSTGAGEDGRSSVIRGGRWRAVVGVAAAAALVWLPVATGGRADAAARAFGAGEVRDVAVTGSGGVPDEGVAAVLVNLTATNVTAPTFVTVWPKGSTRPATSNLNPRPGQDTANLAVIPLDDTGAISVYNHAGRADLVVDVVGWIPTGVGFQAAGTRLVDTRLSGARLGPGSRSSVGVPAVGDGVAILNVTGVGASVATFLTVWPSGAERPATSNLNLADASAAANLVLTPLGGDGAVSIYNLAGSVDVVVDLLGWFPASSGVRALTPARLLDTRATSTPAEPTRSPSVPASAVDAVTGGGAGTLVGTLTGVDATTAAFVTAWSGVGARPATSNLNLPARVAVANLVLVPVAAGGQVALFLNAGRADLLLDATVWVPSGGAVRTVPPARLYDSRTADATGILAPPSRTVTYSVGVRGTITADVTAFAASAQATLDDARGWRAAGISFRQVPTGGNFTLWLSQAELVPGFGPPCTVNYSCRVGRDVIVNEARWRLATPVWTGAGASLDDYHHLVVNHEVGHWLGFDHLLCGGAGQAAPVMLQLS